jgi:hypothetical protein
MASAADIQVCKGADSNQPIAAGGEYTATSPSVPDSGHSRHREHRSLDLDAIDTWMGEISRTSFNALAIA